AELLGDCARLSRELGRFVVSRVAASYQCLGAFRAIRLRKLERAADPALDETRVRCDTPHPRANERLKGKLRVEIRRGQVVVGELDRALHRRGEGLAVEVDGVSVTNLPPDLHLCVSARFELDRALKQ